MEIRYENINIHHTDGTVATTTITHIYSEHGHFLPAGWHIQLGGGSKVEDFVEVLDEGVTHEIPASLPDVDIYDPPYDPEEEATVEDYEAVLSEIFGEENNDEGEINTETDTNAN